MLSKALIHKIKKEILGENYDLSFSYINKEEIHNINKTYRQKDEPTDILSFELSKSNGEILICKEMVKQKSKDFGMTYQNYLIFLFIHGMLHLKGMRHGDKMTNSEKKYIKKYI